MFARNWFATPPRGWFGSRRQTAAKKPLTARPQCEVLEDRVVPASLAHLYGLNGTLADQLAGPALVADGGVLSATRYSFGPDQGLKLTGAMADPTDYSIVMKMQFDSAAPYYKKIIDFSQRLVDMGLYAAGANLFVDPGAFSPDTIPIGSDFQLALTRDGATGEVRLYLNGVLQQTYGSLPAGAAVSPSNVLDFFEDDQASGFTEAGSGSVDYIALYQGALSDADVAALASAVPGVTADNTAVTVTEGQQAVNTGRWSGPAFDIVSLSASVGTVTQNADGTWSWFYDALDSAAAPTTVSITAADQEGDTRVVAFSLTVENAIPQIVTLTSSNPSAANPSTNGLVTIQGSFADAGTLDTHTVTVNWGDGSAAEQSTAVDQTAKVFSGGHQYAQGGVYSIGVSVADEDGAVTTQSVAAVVVNSPPRIVLLTSSDPSAAKPSPNGLVTIQGSFVDPGITNTHTVTVNWGDGSAAEKLSSVNQVTNTFSGGHRYAHGGVYSVTVTVADPSGRAATQTVSAVVTGVGLVDGTLYVVGGPGQDFVSIDEFRRRKHSPWGKAGEDVYRVLTKFASGGAGADRCGVGVAIFDVAEVKHLVVLTGPEDFVLLPRNRPLTGARLALGSLCAAFRELWDSDGPSRRGKESHHR